LEVLPSTLDDVAHLFELILISEADELSDLLERDVGCH
jgi:hypothetical protein